MKSASKAFEHKWASDYRDAAIADGWSHKPTYAKHEPESSACTLDKDGWKMMIFTRTDKNGEPTDVSISIWAPDGLAVKPMMTYNWNELLAGVNKCHNCGTSGVKTVRYSFAGRCCETCLPEMRAKTEFPGWAD